MAKGPTDKSGKRTRRPWHKRVLIPFWVIQIAFCSAIIAIVGVLASSSPGTSIFGLGLIFCIVSIILDITEIVLFCIRRLNTVLFLLSNVAKVALWLTLLVVDIVQVTNRWTNGTENVNILLILVIVVSLILLSFLGTLIYGSVLFHKQRKSKKTADLEKSSSFEHLTQPTAAFPSAIEPARGRILEADNTSPATEVGASLDNEIFETGYGAVYELNATTPAELPERTSRHQSARSSRRSSSHVAYNYSQQQSCRPSATALTKSPASSTTSWTDQSLPATRVVTSNPTGSHEMGPLTPRDLVSPPSSRYSVNGPSDIVSPVSAATTARRPTDPTDRNPSVWDAVNVRQERETPFSRAAR